VDDVAVRDFGLRDDHVGARLDTAPAIIAGGFGGVPDPDVDGRLVQILSDRAPDAPGQAVRLCACGSYPADKRNGDETVLRNHRRAGKLRVIEDHDV
jgi:hypothetical protein